MLLRHEFTVPVRVGEAWPVLVDLARIVPCLPGATLTTVNARDVEGRLRVRVGAVTVTYHGGAELTELDEQDHRVVITARGREARGDGTAEATVTAHLHDLADTTRITIAAELAGNGRLGQVGHEALAGAGGRMLDRFAGRLAELLADTGAGDAWPAAERTEQPAGQPAEPKDERAAGREDPQAEPAAEPAPVRRASPVASFVDYPERSADTPILRRIATALGVVVLAVLVIRRRRRGRLQSRRQGRHR